MYVCIYTYTCIYILNKNIGLALTVAEPKDKTRISEPCSVYQLKTEKFVNHIILCGGECTFIWVGVS